MARGSVVGALVTLALLACGTAQSDDPSLPTELKKDSFYPAMAALPGDSKVLMLFYAHWCPHCIHYKPEYEAACAYLRTVTDLKAGNGLLYVGRVDCANEGDLCGQFNVSAYPTITLGAAADFVAHKRAALTGYEAGRAHTAEATVDWVGKVLGRPDLLLPAHLSTKKGQQGSAVKQSSIKAVVKPAAGAVAGAGGGAGGGVGGGLGKAEWTPGDVEAAMLQLWSIITTTPHLTQGGEKRAALADLLALWRLAAPTARCRAGADALTTQLPALWPPGAGSATDALRAFPLCGQGASADYAACKGSTPERRGYSCGLWLMFHACAARLPEDGSASASASAWTSRASSPSGHLLMAFLRAFNAHFFLCQQCAQHFAGLLTAKEARRVSTKRDALLWLWRAHNAVNGRLAADEAQRPGSSSSDPAYPKVQWPEPAACPACHRHGAQQQRLGRKAATGGSAPMWDEDAVVAYIVRAYGPSGASEAAELAKAQAALLPGGAATGDAFAASSRKAASAAGRSGIVQQGEHITSARLGAASAGAWGRGVAWLQGSSPLARYLLLGGLLAGVISYYVFSTGMVRRKRWRQS